ncbi:MAG: hypothetical protein ACRC62_20965 [Microcoleus sp.]
MNALSILKNRQARTRNDFARRNKCECLEQTPPAEFKGVGAGSSASVAIRSQIVPVKMMTNGWVSPTTIAPVIISGGVGYFGGMPKGR